VARKPEYVTIFVRIPKTRANKVLKAKIKAYAGLNGITLSEWMLEAMLAYQEEQKKNPNFRRIVEGR
jgi:hypothetical protein